MCKRGVLVTGISLMSKKGELGMTDKVIENNQVTVDVYKRQLQGLKKRWRGFLPETIRWRAG